MGYELKLVLVNPLDNFLGSVEFSRQRKGENKTELENKTGLTPPPRLD